MALVVAIVVFVVLGFYALRLVKQRSVAFLAEAEGLGLDYVGSASPFGTTNCAGLTLITDTHRHRYRNVLAAKGGGAIVIPQYTYGLYARMAKQGTAQLTENSFHTHALILYRTAQGTLPSFQVSSRGMFGNVDVPLTREGFEAATGLVAGIDVGSPAFAERYVVTGEDEARIRKLFGPAVVQALVEQPDKTWLHVQASPDWLLFYDPRIVLLDPQDIPPALERVRPLARLLGVENA